MRPPKDLPVEKVVARNFARFREEAGLRQNEAAELGDITFSALTKIEQGLRGMPRATTLNKFAELYARKIEHFFMQDPPPCNEEELLNRAIWRVKVTPGLEPDADLAAKLEEFLKDLTREQRQRMRARQQEKEKEKEKEKEEEEKSAT
jgi:transcriptional regulator with XRE-family HTH domain